MRAPNPALHAAGVMSLVLLLTACGDESNSVDTDATADAAMDAQAPDAAPDGGGTGDPCGDVLTTGVTFELDPAGPDTQIHVSAAFDGEAVWVVYNLPDGASYFDVWAVRLGCDGAPIWGPERINTTDANDVDPVVATGDGNVYFAWHSDNNTGINNMDILYRTFAVSGTPLMATDRILETTHDGTPVVGNAMAPDVTALPNSQFAIAGVRGLDGAQAFQAFVQRLDADGTLVGDALDAIFEPTVSQLYPAIAALPDGAIYLAYTRSTGIDDDQIYHTRFAAGVAVPDPDPPVPALTGSQGIGPDYAADPAGDQVYLAFGDGAKVVLTDGAVFGASALVELNQGSGADFNPVVAPRDGGGAVFWYLNLGGFSNELNALPFSYDGTDFTLGSRVTVTPQYVPPYPPAATHVQGDVYFVAWSEGDNPDYRVMGRFVVLE